MGYFAIGNNGYFGDEGFHAERIRNFLAGNFDLATPSAAPGFHLTVWAFAAPFHQDSLQFFRGVSLIFGLLSVVVFHAARKTITATAAPARTIQYVFNPIVYPFLFFAYTDGFSLFLVLLAALLLLRRRYVLMMLAGIAAIIVRQNNILWFAFFFLLFFWQEIPAFLRFVPRWIRKKIPMVSDVRVSRKIPWGVIAANIVFLIACALFVAFLKWNGGIALGDKEAHPFPSFHTGNIFFCLFLAFFFFLPLHIANIRPVMHRIATSRFLLPLLTLTFLIYVLSFFNTHFYNQGLDSVYLRNRILVYFTMTEWHRMIFFIPVGLTILSLTVTKLSRPEFYLFYPMTVVFLCLSWLIEQRYYMIPLSLFLLFREERSQTTENASALYELIFAMALFIPIVLLWFFL